MGENKKSFEETTVGRLLEAHENKMKLLIINILHRLSS